MNKTVKLIKQALLDTHQLTQKRSGYHYRGVEVRHPKELADKPSLRSLLDPARKTTPEPLLDVLLTKTYEIGVSDGYVLGSNAVEDRRILDLREMKEADPELYQKTIAYLKQHRKPPFN